MTPDRARQLAASHSFTPRSRLTKYDNISLTPTPMNSLQSWFEEALPVLWACREEWVEAQDQQNDPKELEELRRDLVTRTTERDTALNENNLLKELLSAYRNIPTQRAIPSVEDPTPAAIDTPIARPSPTPSQEQLRF
jgi:hypothetical protein